MHQLAHPLLYDCVHSQLHKPGSSLNVNKIVYVMMWKLAALRYCPIYAAEVRLPSSTTTVLNPP